MRQYDDTFTFLEVIKEETEKGKTTDEILETLEECGFPFPSRDIVDLYRNRYG